MIKVKIREKNNANALDLSKITISFIIKNLIDIKVTMIFLIKIKLNHYKKIQRYIFK